MQPCAFRQVKTLWQKKKQVTLKPKHLAGKKLTNNFWTLFLYFSINFSQIYNLQNTF